MSQAALRSVEDTSGSNLSQTMQFDEELIPGTMGLAMHFKAQADRSHVSLATFLAIKYLLTKTEAALTLNSTRLAVEKLQLICCKSSV